MNYEIKDQDFTNPEWLKAGREDLNNIPKMIANGFVPLFNYEDKKHGRTFPDNVPHYPVSFKKGNFHVWKFYQHTSDGYYMKWQTARLIDGHYCNHKPCDNLDEVIEYEKEIL